MIEGNPADLSQSRISAALTTERYGRSLQLLASTRSTNDDARTAALGGAPIGHVVVADAQSQGRGSQGRVWSSPRGSDLYLSIVDRPDIQMAQLPPLTLAVGLGVADTVADNVGSAAVEVKWPNDIWVEGRKCAGVLLEASSTGHTLDALVIGIGLNVNRTGFPGDLEHPATSIALARRDATKRGDETVQPLDRCSVLCTLLANVERWVRTFEGGGAAPVVSALAQRLALRGQNVQCGQVRGQLLGLATDGALRIVTSRGEQHCITGQLRRLS